MRSNHEREAWVIYLFTTGLQTVNCCSTIHALELTYIDSNTLETMKKQLYLSDTFKFPPLHWRCPAKGLTVVQAFTCISYVYNAQKDVTPSNVNLRRHGRFKGWRHKTAPNSTIFYHWLYRRGVLEYYVKSLTVWGFGCHDNLNLALVAKFSFFISETDVGY